MAMSLASQRLLLRTASQAVARPALFGAAAGSCSTVRAFGAASVVAARPSSVRLGAVSAAQQPYIKGTVNDATTFPPPSKTHGSYHWTFERLLAASLIPIVASTAVTSANPILDGILCVTLVLHSHLGFDSCLEDYLHPRKFPVIGTICKWTLRILTGGSLYGLYEFNTNDIGLTELVKRTWTAKSAA